MTMLNAMQQAMPGAMPDAYANGIASQAMHERTDGRTNEEITHVRHKTFCSDTCAHIQISAYLQTQPLTRSKGIRMSNTTTDNIVAMPYDAQAVVIFLGDGMPLILRDHDAALGEYFAEFTEATRAVTVARLRSYADAIEASA